MKDKKIITLQQGPEKALLISIRTQKVTDEEAEESLRELGRLVTTLGFQVLASESQRMAKSTGGSVLGEGKLKELEKYTKDGEELADLVIFDCELTPSQIRNVEDALGVQVMDRTGVIIEIFSRHAKTRAALLQVEIARLNYLAPRLREKKKIGDKQHFAGRGAGESQIELDRRRIRDRKAELKQELEEVQREQDNRRSRREEQMSVVLVGYTNAGKSSTMRALTGSDVLVENKLFATLDTTVRALQPETHPRILVSDTVGFINKLPHDLVASFRSTLEEARHASILLYVVDASDPSFRDQLAVVNEVLEEVGVEGIHKQLILNKSDCLTIEQKENLMIEFPEAMMMSAKNEADIKKLYQWIVQFFDQKMIQDEFFVPYGQQGVIGDIHTNTKVIKEECDNEGTHFIVRSTSSHLERLRKILRS
ncbi:MAG: GTPase HflX [Bdellovibrio sp. CG12_big_fil_rev_8_21_14_0_65_39_13]|nr:MAG: GTPase HflX [Bdellovibrio sp. CG22_combo_CG10-13_8_21_14_all_39_27]PIQ58744.1 MAG: GTPase HflX [Bdellovibrio sp. CG12_big_fil_rev_8_21_14_0_65_39_13]PIR35575.1 MAG: GTPase HflX [Bdellovibrio sp. CG11_big_fil_rev_8_21_14_0_20_39_38]